MVHFSPSIFKPRRIHKTGIRWTEHAPLHNCMRVNQLDYYSFALYATQYNINLAFNQMTNVIAYAGPYLNSPPIQMII